MFMQMFVHFFGHYLSKLLILFDFVSAKHSNDLCTLFTPFCEWQIIEIGCTAFGRNFMSAFIYQAPVYTFEKKNYFTSQ